MLRFYYSYLYLTDSNPAFGWSVMPILRCFIFLAFSNWGDVVHSSDIATLLSRSAYPLIRAVVSSAALELLRNWGESRTWTRLGWAVFFVCWIKKGKCVVKGVIKFLSSFKDVGHEFLINSIIRNFKSFLLCRIPRFRAHSFHLVKESRAVHSYVPIANYTCSNRGYMCCRAFPAHISGRICTKNLRTRSRLGLVPFCRLYQSRQLGHLCHASMAPQIDPLKYFWANFLEFRHLRSKKQWHP